MSDGATLPMIRDLLRALSPQVLGVVARRTSDFATAEDAVQEALLAASTQWPEAGLPDDPRAWLVQVAARRLLDRVRSDSARRKRETRASALEPDDAAFAPPPDSDREPEQDDMLLLLFMCCHPALTRTSAIALTLRAVGGLTTAEIARSFLVPEATMAQRISRAKRLIEQAGGRFAMPGPSERSARLAAVLHVLYLVFNEGYLQSSGAGLSRVDLSDEAIRLARELERLLPDEREAQGLLALMLLTDARRPARSGPDGELVPLDEQDRSRWDRRLVREGTELVSRALAGGAPGVYQLQAAIAALHDEAPSVDETDWPQILALYDVLERITQNPIVTLNRAIAFAMVHGPERGLELLEPLGRDARLREHHLLFAARGHLSERAGDHAAALAAFRGAAERTSSVPERNYLWLKAARLRQAHGLR